MIILITIGSTSSLSSFVAGALLTTAAEGEGFAKSFAAVLLLG